MNRLMRSDALVPVLLAVSAVISGCGGEGGLDSANTPTRAGDSAGGIIQVLSNRPDLISEGDALIELRPQGDSKDFRLTLNGSDVSDQLAVRENGRIMGVVTGLKLGENTLAVSGGVGTASILVHNHPNHGPIFSAGQHRLADWDTCAAGGQSALEDCNRPVEYLFHYKSTDPNQTQLLRFDPEEGIPEDVAMTTTDQGITVPFIVREEQGFQDRDRYFIGVLYNPEQPWSALEPQVGWNGKLLMTHGAGCSMSFQTSGASLSTNVQGQWPGGGGPPASEHVDALARGFAVMSTALNNNGHNCDVVLQAESMMMAKERLIEQYGEIRYTIGTGCSGGAITQLTVANAYPGIYQGLLTACTYPDSISPAVQAFDYHLMRQYFEDPTRWAPGVVWSPHQFGLVEGHISHANAVVMDEGLFKPAVTVAGNCAGPDSYHPTNNPQGVRCGAIEWADHIWGTRMVEAKTDDGTRIEVSELPAGNSGILYGLETLETGQITPAQFVDLNVKIGGLDFDMQRMDERSKARPEVLERVFRSGFGNVTTHLDRVAMINFLGPDPALAHDSVHAYWVRWRLDREHGQHDNHVMWAGPSPLIGDPYFYSQGLVAMDRWLAAVEADPGQTPLAQKISQNRPADVHDQCSDGFGHKVADEVCVELIRYPYAYGTPRTVAGANENASNYECQLKPLRQEDFILPFFTPEQWAQLEAVFPDGVCDYSLPGLGEEVKTVPWLTYQDGNGGITVGGAALPPARFPAAWASPAFADQWDFAD